ncbi:hypothetical protein H4R34_002560 [Dimargaris verticillata]|uniref:Uncharacterized protein n=1 Tax=Dimargaris verticillata TaxID=2761393 RepID=A0A9W8E9V5_9FUNG|nr:hypothetical protein H4R34_002560 [Dimargaris verticillata]
MNAYPGHGRVYRFFRLDNFDAERFVTSNLVKPRMLFAIRLALALYCIATVVVLFVTTGVRFFHYMTDWSYLGLTVYMMLATVVSGRYCFGAMPYSPGQNLLERAPSWARALYWFLYETVVTFHILVPVVYWALLSSQLRTDTSLELYSSIAPHAIDFVVMAVELIFNRQILEVSHVVIPVIILALYLALAFLVWGTEHYFVYSFLDFYKLHGWVALICVAIAVAFCIIFFVQLYLHRLREYLFRKRWAKQIVNSHKPYEPRDSSLEMGPTMAGVPSYHPSLAAPTTPFHSSNNPHPVDFGQFDLPPSQPGAPGTMAPNPYGYRTS